MSFQHSMISPTLFQRELFQQQSLLLVDGVYYLSWSTYKPAALGSMSLVFWSSMVKSRLNSIGMRHAGVHNICSPSVRLFILNSDFGFRVVSRLQDGMQADCNISFFNNREPHCKISMFLLRKTNRRLCHAAHPTSNSMSNSRSDWSNTPFEFSSWTCIR